MSRGGGGAGVVAHDRAAEDADQQEDILPQRPTLRCIGCGAPTDRLQGICRRCLAAHYRIDGLIRAQEILHASGGAAVLPAVLDLAGVTR